MATMAIGMGAGILGGVLGALNNKPTAAQKALNAQMQDFNNYVNAEAKTEGFDATSVFQNLMGPLQRIVQGGPQQAGWNASVTTTITASATLQVAAATKWLSRSIRFTAQPSNTVTKQANIWITDASGNVMWETNGPVFTPTNTLVYETLLYPSGYVSTGTTVAAGYIASARGTSTQVITLGIPEMHLGPSFQINAMLNGAAGTATYTLSANVLQLSD